MASRNTAASRPPAADSRSRVTAASTRVSSRAVCLCC